MLEFLPEELLINIAKFLHPLEIVRCTRVSKCLYRICTDSDVWKWKCLQLGYSLSELRSSCPSVSVLRHSPDNSPRASFSKNGVLNLNQQSKSSRSWKTYFFDKYHSDLIGSLYRGESIHIEYQQSFDCYAYNAIEVIIRNNEPLRDDPNEQDLSPIHLIIEIGLRRDDSNTCRFAIDVRTAATLKKWRAVVDELLHFQDPSTSSAGFAHFIQVITLDISRKTIHEVVANNTTTTNNNSRNTTQSQKITSSSFVYYKQRPLLETVCEYYRQKYEEFQRNQALVLSHHSPLEHTTTNNNIITTTTTVDDITNNAIVINNNSDTTTNDVVIV